MIGQHNCFAPLSRNKGFVVAAVLLWLLTGAASQGQSLTSLTIPKRGSTVSIDALADWSYYNRIGWIALRNGNLDRAAQSFRKEIEAIRPYESADRSLLARSYTEYSRVLYQQKRFADAEPLARWALSVRDESPGNNSEPLLENLELMAQISHARGHGNESINYVKRTLAVKESIVGKGDPDLIPILDQLADLYIEQGNIAQAEPAYNRSQLLRETTTEISRARAERIQLDLTILNNIIASGAVGYRSPQQRIVNMARAERMRDAVILLQEAAPDSISSAVSTEHMSTLLRKVGRTREADSFAVRAKAMRDAAETRAAAANRLR